MGLGDEKQAEKELEEWMATVPSRKETKGKSKMGGDEEKECQ